MMQQRSLLPCLIFIGLFRHLPRASAQSTDANCLSSFNWAFNSRAQSPCLIGAFLQSVCIPNFNVPALPPDNHYTGPAFNTANPCSCSTVTYSLISACGACQNRTFQSWGNWSMNCGGTTTSIASYPEDIPLLTSVPAWAYLNIEETNDTFDPERAQALVGAPESTGSFVPQSTATTTTATDVQSTLTSVPASTRASTSQSHHSDAGAIAGGVVGGIACIAIVAVASIWFFSRRSRQRHSRANAVAPGNIASPPNPITPQMATPSMTTSPVMNEALLHPNKRTSNLSLNAYSPPSAYPTSSSNYITSPTTSVVYTTYDPSRVSFDNVRHGRGYSGAPEV